MLGAIIAFTNATSLVTNRTSLPLADMTLDGMVHANDMFTLFRVVGVLLAKWLLANGTGFATTMATSRPALRTLLHAWC